MKIKNSKISIFRHILFVALISAPVAISLFSLSKSYAEPDTDIDIYKAIQQVAYSYYMRGPYIQYNSQKGNPAYFSPEESTSQNMNYMTCSAFC